MAQNPSRREFVKKAGYIAPVILTLNATPAFAGRGSTGPEYGDRGHGSRCGAPRGRGRGRGHDRDRGNAGHGHGHGHGRVAKRQRGRRGWFRRVIIFFIG